jgi:hypothetical protein
MELDHFQQMLFSKKDPPKVVSLDTADVNAKQPALPKIATEAKDVLSKKESGVKKEDVKKGGNNASKASVSQSQPVKSGNQNQSGNASKGTVTPKATVKDVPGAKETAKKAQEKDAERNRSKCAMY